MTKTRATVTRTLGALAAAVAMSTVLAATPAHAGPNDNRLYQCIEEVGSSDGEYTPNVVLATGSTGICVEELQSDLLALGAVRQQDIPGFVDGDFGPKTYAAVVTFQRRASVAGGADGIVGPNTWKRLVNAAYFD
ncbi:peptidoglycan-binding protein [Streptomyces sp. ISL-66]|uniref:peptidoglycan-binding domain-containing protein n=1 Tax=Streptomyces sp. ISL-66 TaxID=2819186 RepID=UPI001BE85460|nr:peptidoglycan-binding domain-containing protein [Streptomyces sp. ISL-66]MBT2471843.1 peptidoglycan-binding protein [Streptomyces sp. ISL-66]